VDRTVQRQDPPEQRISGHVLDQSAFDEQEGVPWRVETPEQTRIGVSGVDRTEAIKEGEDGVTECCPVAIRERARV
jgi:hypothetical protein